jgi:hypothetical protein
MLVQVSPEAGKIKLVHVQINCIFFDNTLYIYNIYVTEALQHTVWNTRESISVKHMKVQPPANKVWGGI